MNYSDIYTVCYDRLDVFKTKDEAKKFYTRCYYSSEGAEHERYASILVDLNFSNVGKDNVSSYCNEISIKSNNQENVFLNIKLNDALSIDDAIKYYEEKIKPILEVSEEYDVDFNNKIPFEDFGSDEEAYTNTSFSNYYKDILEKFNINDVNVLTDSFSDGKYKLTINNQEFKITAWDNLESVIDNIDLMIEKFKSNDVEMEV